MDSPKHFMFDENSLKSVRTKVAGEMMNNIDHEQPLSPMSHLFHEPNSIVYVLFIMGFKTQINPDVIKKNLVHTLLKHPRFSCLQVLDEKSGVMKWVRTNVDLENHVIVPTVSQNLESPEKFVEDYISNLSKTTVDMSMPLWDLHILNLKTSDAESVGIVRMHHSFGDGISLMFLLLASTRKVSDPRALSSISLMKKRSEPRDLSWFWCYLFKFWFFVLLLWNTTMDVFMFIATALFLKDSDTPLKGLDDCGSAARRIVHRIFSFDDVRMVKNAMNTTVNDVVVRAIQAGLSRYLNRIYGNSISGSDGKKHNIEATKNGTNYLPEKIRLRATVIVNMRQSPEIHALANSTENNIEGLSSNCLGQILLPFTIAIREDPLDYVRDAKANMDRKKCSLGAVIDQIIMKLIFNFFGVKGASILSQRIPSHTSLFFSNLPGPREEIAYCGYPITYLAPSCYGLPNALMIHVQSYMNKMAIVLSVDERTIPDPHQLCNDIEESLKLIRDCVIGQGIVKNIGATSRG